MQNLKNPSLTRATPPFAFSSNAVASKAHARMSGHASACPVVDTHVHVHGAMASAIAGGASAPVQTIRESSSRCTSESDWVLNRRDKYRLQNVGSKILDHAKEWGRNRLSMCGKYKLKYGAEGAWLMHDEHAGHAWIEGLAMCDSPWTCAICASRLGEAKADDVRKIENYARDQGHGLSLLTLTSHHTREMDLGELLRMQSDALKLFWSGRQAQAFKKSWGLIGFIRAFEVTHSAKAGFHPHYHYLLVTERHLTEEERAKMAVELFDRWVESSTRAGLKKPSERGFDLKTGVTAGQYVAKWGLAREMSKGSSKVGRGEESRNMWQVLSDAEHNDADAKLWVSYALATKGKAQQFWTKELKNILESIDEAEEKEAEEGEAEERNIDAVFISEAEVLDLYTTDEVGRNWCNLFEIIETYGLGPVRDWLVRRRHWAYDHQDILSLWGGREPYAFDV